MLSRRYLIPVAMFAAIAVVSLLLGRGGAAVGPESPASEPEVVALGAPAGGEEILAEVPPEVETFLRNEQYWRAARAMRDYLGARRSPEPGAVLVAARAEAGWGGWEQVRDYLDDAPWLDEVGGGEGWYWLARAAEEDEDWEDAAAAYARYLAVAPESAAHRRVAELRRALTLLRAGEAEEGVTLLAEVRDRAPEVSEWAGLLAAEAAAERGDTARARALAPESSVDDIRVRAGRALVRAYAEAGDPRTARRYALAGQRDADGAGTRAAFALAAGEMALELDEEGAAREDFRTVLRIAPGSSAAREAAALLSDLPGLTAEDRLRIARVWHRHGNYERAARGYRAWLRSDAGSAKEQREVRLRLGRALFSAGDYGEVEDALEPLFDADAATASEALHLVGRAQYRRGREEQALRTFERVAERFPGTHAGSEALFLVGDLSHDEGEIGVARRAYRQVASNFRGRDRAGLSLMRLGGIEFLEGDYAEAAEAWEEYRSTYPSGERWLQATYWAGRSYEAMGNEAAARGRYEAVREREPISYYALRASERLGEDFWPVPLSAAPARDAAAEARVEEWMGAVDLLREAGLHDEAESQADALIDRAGSDPALLYPLAEALNERGYTLRAIRIGRLLSREADPPNERLLRILYPFPYRAMVVAEAREKGLDPFMVAALARQESMFKARISSPVGARGLMQIMPKTGQVLARGAGIRDWDPELLFQPEINAHLGTRYLADQMRAYDGSLPSVFSAYNAGPHRVERWQRFPEYGDEELFTERIPYRETRDYVKILTRNIAIYRALYGDA